MTTRHAIELDSVFLLAVSAVAGSVFALYFNHKPNIKSSISLPVMQNSQGPTSIPASASTIVSNSTSTVTSTPAATPLPTPITSKNAEKFSQISPDGAKILTMTVTRNKDDSKTYAFATSDSASTNQQSIYSKTLLGTGNMSIPFNTWSPDNNYVFLQQNGATTSGAIVMKADGQPLVEGEQFFDVISLFTAKNTGNSYQETTGWASETLLIVNTKQQDGSKGPSYWFEVPSKAIIQLSTQF